MVDLQGNAHSDLSADYTDYADFLAENWRQGSEN